MTGAVLSRRRDPATEAGSRSSRRLFVLRVLVLSLLLTLLGRLWYLQVLVGDRFEAAASANRVREVVTPAARGQVLDDVGRPLVRNRTSLVVSVNRAALLRQPDDGAAVLERLGRVVGLTPAEISARIRPCGGGVPQPCWNGSPYQPVPVKPDATPAMSLAIDEHREQFPGVTTELQAVREYPHRALGAHVLGYLSPISPDDLADERYAGYRPTDLVGRGGLEEVYDARLRGVPGVTEVAVDRFGTVEGTVAETPPRAGDHLVLSLDAQVQNVAERALAEGIARARATYDPKSGKNFVAPAGSVVVLEARTSRVVAVASNPSYDPSVFVGGVTPEEYAALTSEAAGVPLVSRATQGQFAPGSTFKIVSTASAVRSGVAHPGGAYPCPGRLRVGNGFKQNFEGRGIPGQISLHTALVKSCDTIYYSFASSDWYADEARTRAGGGAAETLQAVAREFGFGAETGVDLPSEGRGRIVDRAYKKQRWEKAKRGYCADARRGYPDEADPERRAFLERLARENCSDGYRYRLGDHVDLSIGQGETVVTPLQLANAYAALANGGTLHAPRLAKALLRADGSGVTEIPPTVIGRLGTDRGLLAYMSAALAEVPTTGTARGAFAGFPLDRLRVAGKTGTAQVFGKQDTSWFASYAPAERPEYVVVAMVEEAGTGGSVAAPIVRAVYEGMYGLAGRPPALPGAAVRAALPCVLPDGTVQAPGRCPPPQPAAPLVRATPGADAPAGTADAAGPAVPPVRRRP